MVIPSISGSTQSLQSTSRRLASSVQSPAPASSLPRSTLDSPDTSRLSAPGATEAVSHKGENTRVNGYTPEQKAAIRDLSNRDREVRAHEQAHSLVGGAYTSAPSFNYQRGPDGRMYAVGGDVRIDSSPVAGDPQATLEKALIIHRAALAPVEPSAIDRSVAIAAAAMAVRARAEIAGQSSAANNSRDIQSTTEQNADQKSERVGSDQRPSILMLHRQLVDGGAVSNGVAQGSLIDFQV